MSLPSTTGLSVAQPTPLTCASCATLHHQAKKTILSVCLLTFYSVGALSLPISHGKHLVVPTHPCFFWAVCHPSRTFPPKEPKQEPQNRFSPLPTAKPYPLTFDPWPTTSCIGWVQAGDAWALRVLCFCVCPKLARCSCICRGLEARLLILLPTLDFLWPKLFSDFPFFMVYSL